MLGLSVQTKVCQVKSKTMPIKRYWYLVFNYTLKSESHLFTRILKWILFFFYFKHLILSWPRDHSNTSSLSNIIKKGLYRVILSNLLLSSIVLFPSSTFYLENSGNPVCLFNHIQLHLCHLCRLPIKSAMED